MNRGISNNSDPLPIPAFDRPLLQTSMQSWNPTTYKLLVPFTLLRYWSSAAVSASDVLKYAMSTLLGSTFSRSATSPARTANEPGRGVPSEPNATLVASPCTTYSPG